MPMFNCTVSTTSDKPMYLVYEKDSKQCLIDFEEEEMEYMVTGLGVAFNIPLGSKAKLFVGTHCRYPKDIVVQNDPYVNWQFVDGFNYDALSYSM